MSNQFIALRFLRSAGAATFSQAWRVAVTLATHFVLRRLVPEEDWGLFEWTTVVFLVLGACRDLGLNAHVLRIRPRPFGNLLRLELVWGGALVALTWLGAPLLSQALSTPHAAVVPVLRAMGLFLFFEGLAIVPLMYFDGELAVGQAVPAEILRNLVYAVTAVSIALAGYGVWSMVVAQIVGSAVFAAVLWGRAWGRIELHYVPGQTLRLLRSSYRLAVIWLLVLLVQNVDPLILGAMVDLEIVGTYGFAYWAAFIVPKIVLQPIGRVAFPTFIAFAEHRRKLFETYRLATLAILAAEVPAAIFFFTNAETALSLVSGDQFPGAPRFLYVLCFVPLLDPFSRLGGEVLASRHQDRRWIVATATTLASFVVFGTLFTWKLGAMGMALANYLPLGAVVMIASLRRLAPDGLGPMVRDLAWIYLLPVPGFVAAVLIGGDRPWLRFALSIAAVLLALLFYYRRFGDQIRQFLRPDPEVAGPRQAAAQ